MRTACAAAVALLAVALVACGEAEPTPTPVPTIVYVYVEVTPTPTPSAPTPTPTARTEYTDIAAYLAATCWPGDPQYNPTPEAHRRARLGGMRAFLEDMRALEPPPGYAAFHRWWVYAVENALWRAENEDETGSRIDTSNAWRLEERDRDREQERLSRLVPEAAKDDQDFVCR